MVCFHGRPGGRPSAVINGDPDSVVDWPWTARSSPVAERPIGWAGRQLAARFADKYDVHLNGLAGITRDVPNSFYDLDATVETSRFQLTGRA